MTGLELLVKQLDEKIEQLKESVVDRIVESILRRIKKFK